jgi:hypothetical protein
VLHNQCLPTFGAAKCYANPHPKPCCVNHQLAVAMILGIMGKP